MPQKLAKAVCSTAQGMATLEVVQALDKCQSMAFKAKVLNGKLGTKEGISDMRQLVENLLKGETDVIADEKKL